MNDAYESSRFWRMMKIYDKNKKCKTVGNIIMKKFILTQTDIFTDWTTYFKTEKQIKHTHTVRITILIKHELALAAAIKYKLMHNSILTMPRLRPNLADWCFCPNSILCRIASICFESKPFLWKTNSNHFIWYGIFIQVCDCRDGDSHNYW